MKLLIKKLQLGNLKLFLKVGSLVFVAIVLFYIYNSTAQVLLERDYAENYNEIIENEPRLEERAKQLNTSNEAASLYLPYLDLLVEQQNSAKQELTILNQLESRIFYKYFPEYKSYLLLQKSLFDQYIREYGTLIEWYREAIKPEPNQEKLASLFKKSDQEKQKTALTLSNLENAPANLSPNLVFKYPLSLAAVIILGILGIMLVIGNFVFFIKRVKSKLVLPALGWFAIGATDLLLLIAISYEFLPY